jgi:hypothetical protein
VDDSVMAKFRLNKDRVNQNKNYVVHEESCSYFNQINQFVELGDFLFCSTALQRARALGYNNVDGCKICCLACHLGQ